MNPEAVELSSPSRPKRPHVAFETWALLGLAIGGLLTLAWMGLFAWATARTIGLI
jgi:hypothetical protein